MQLANSARTTLVTGINAVVSTLTLSDETAFPTVTATTLTGTVTTTAGNVFGLTGTGTLFTSELAVGDVVTWTGIEWRRVVHIIDDTHMIVDRDASGVAGVTLTKRDAYYITVSSGGGLTREYMLVLATSGATFTVARAQDNSTALVFAAGSAVEYRVTAGFVRQVIADAVVSALKNLAETHGADLIGVSAVGIGSDTVREALEELAVDISDHLADTADAHDASAISFSPAGGIAATDVQAAILEAKTDALASLSTHEGDTSAAHAASAISFSPAGNVASTNVQAAIEEMDTAYSAISGDSDKMQDIIETAGKVFSAVDDTLGSKAVSVYVSGSDYWSCAGSGGAFTLSAPTVSGTASQTSYTGTGNGTMTSIVGGSTSVAEVFTVACTTGGGVGVGIFSVTGSVSGALANATVGTPYSTTKVGFTINDGATDFIAGDTFLVTTTAAWTMRKPSSYYEGMRIRFIANAANNASATVDVGGLGAKSITVPPFGDALPANAWISGTPVELVYTGSGFVMVKHNATIPVFEVKTSGTSWTFPAGVTAVTVHLVGSGSDSTANADGGDSTATYNSVTVTAGKAGTGGGHQAGGTATNADFSMNGATGIATAGFENGTSFWSPSYGDGVNGTNLDPAGAGAYARKRFTRVAGLNTITYAVATAGANNGVVVFEYVPWTDA